MREESMIDELLEALQGAMYMMEGMQLDPNIHQGARTALAEKADELYELIKQYT